MFRITGVEVKERERKSDRQARKIVKGFLAERGEWLGDAANLQLQSVQEALQRQKKNG